MSKITFAFIVIGFLLLPFGALESEWLKQAEAIISAILIGTFGISHGAIDNHLYGFKNTRENIRFITIYVISALLFGLVWLVHSNIAFLLFLLISAYHFGQSQFIVYARKKLKLERTLYLIWGSWLLLIFISMNSAELYQSYFASLLNIKLFRQLLYFSNPLSVFFSVLLLMILFYNVWRDRLSVQQCFIELYQLFAIAVVFFISSPLVGFTIYFVILHSIRVLSQEYQYFQSKNNTFSIASFIKMILPFTLISLIGLAFLVLIVFWFELSISLPLTALIFISCLTFPHAFVMDIFYQKNKPKFAES